MDPKPAHLTIGQRFKQRILNHYCVRFHMSLIVMAVVASGVLANKLMLSAGFHHLWLRYPVAVLLSYCAFLGLVRMWISYVTVRRTLTASADYSDGLSLDPTCTVSGEPSMSFGGGDSGGAGASDSWGDAEPSTGGSSWISDLGFDLDLGDDGWWILLLIALLALVILCTGGYLVWAAPNILGEAAWQAVLGAVLVRSRQHTRAGWMGGVLRSTAIPFALVLVVAAVLGWQAHRHCPNAARLAEVFHCAAE